MILNMCGLPDLKKKYLKFGYMYPHCSTVYHTSMFICGIFLYAHRENIYMKLKTKQTKKKLKQFNFTPKLLLELQIIGKNVINIEIVNKN